MNDSGAHEKSPYDTAGTQSNGVTTKKFPETDKTT